MEKIFKKLIFYLYLSLIFFTPLIYLNITKELFEFPKIIFVYLLGTVIIAIFIIKQIFYPKKLSIPALPIIGFSVSFIISTVFSTNVYTSVWGYYSRFCDGLLPTLVFVALYYVFVNTFTKEERADIFWISLLALIPISLYGIFQHYGFISPYKPIERVYSTFGQPNWLAQYLVILLPIVLIMAVAEKGFLHYGLLYLLGFTCLWFTYSLSGVMGFFAGTGMVALLTKWNKQKLKVFGLILTICFAIAVINSRFLALRWHDFWTDTKSFITHQTSYVEKAFAEALDTNSEQQVNTQANPYAVSDTGFIRKGMAEGSFKLAISSVKNFFIGTGPETFPYEFQAFRPAYLNYSSEWEFILNKPHNYYLEILVEQGILGLVMYFWLVFYIFKRMPKILIPGFIAFLVTNFFGWPVVATSLIFWLGFAGMAKE